MADFGAIDASDAGEMIRVTSGSPVLNVAGPRFKPEVGLAVTWAGLDWPLDWPPADSKPRLSRQTNFCTFAGVARAISSLKSWTLWGLSWGWMARACEMAATNSLE